jgi:cytidylate kinase
MKLENSSTMKKIGNGEPKEIIFSEIEATKPNFIYVCGMVASGKSTLSNKIGEMGYKIVHIDELVREEFPIWPKNIYLDSTLDESQTLSADQEKLFHRIKKEIDGEEKIVVDGFISPMLWKTLYEYRKWDLLIYVQHRNLESYREAISRRAIDDLEKNRQTLSSFWRDPRSEKMIAEYKNQGSKSPILIEMIEENARHKWEILPERRAYIESIFEKNNWPYYIYYTDINYI